MIGRQNNDYYYKMDKYLRFLRNIAKEPRNARARRRLMDRELKKLQGNDGSTSDKLDAGER